MIYIVPQDTGKVLPVVVIGVKGLWPYLEDQLANGSFPEWVVALELQTEGYNCTLQMLVGAVLRLEDNLDRLNHGGHLIHGLRAMAADPNMDLLRRHYPVLHDLVTHGREYTQGELTGLTGYLSQFAAFPRLVSGVEAMVQFEEQASRWFEGWRTMQVRVPEGLTPTQVKGGIYIEEPIIYQCIFELGERWSVSMEEVLFTLAVRLPDAKVGVWLVWENSD